MGNRKSIYLRDYFLDRLHQNELINLNRKMMKFSILLSKKAIAFFFLIYILQYAPLILCAQKLVGTTTSGGSSLGTIFKMDTNTSTYTNLFNFSTSNGQQPSAGLVEGKDGMLYGTTAFGGTNDGIIYKIASDGTDFQILHSFGAVTNDGRFPYGALVEHSNGSFYGTASSGGANSNQGIIFQIDSDGSNYQILHSFGSFSGDGRAPTCTLIEGNNGNLFGTAAYSSSDPNIFGVVFTIQPDGNNYNVLHAFNQLDGELPFGELFAASDGYLYGMTREGGVDHDQGVLFRIQEDGTKFSKLYEFSNASGYAPNGGLIEAGSGLYGLASTGGASGYGTIFRWDLGGTGFTVLHEFDGNNGNGPLGSLFLASDGKIYGVCSAGGSNNSGNIFSIDIPGNFSVVHNFAPLLGSTPYFVQLQELSITLPVSWSSFTARAINDQVRLSWTTQTETNNHGFDIQRSTNGNNWETIGFQEAGEAGHTQQNYQFVDLNPSSGKLYYRLKQWDEDGTFNFSEVRTLSLKGDPYLRIFPNPLLSDQLQVEFIIDHTSSGTIKIFNHLGQEVFYMVPELTKGKNMLSIDIDHLPKGSYFLQINEATGGRTSAFLVE